MRIPTQNLDQNDVFEILAPSSEDYEEEEFDTQFESIPLQEYKRLMDSQLNVFKLQNAIGKMGKVIKSIDSELKVLKRAQNHSINVSKLSDVSVFRTYLFVCCSDFFKFTLCDIFLQQREVIDCLVNGIKTQSYSENVRKFALKQQYYSTAAYKSLRLSFKKNLPAERTLQLWSTCVDGSPGISGSALNI